MWSGSGHKVDMPRWQQFLRYLRDGLNHLQDLHCLRRSPLVTLFGLANRFDAPLALQRILTEAIESLEPKSDEPPRSRAWRMYESLFYRYVEQFSQQKIADQLGMSTRQLRREQRAALEALALQLWEQFDLQASLPEGTDLGAAATGLAAGEELTWLKHTPLEKPTDLNQTLSAVVDLVRPLAARYGVRLQMTTSEGPANVAVHPVGLGQILLNLLGVAMHMASGSQVYISIRPQPWDVEIKVRCKKCPSGLSRVSDEDAASLEMAHRLADLCGGRLTLSDDQQALIATLTLPASEQLPVLAIDDNTDTLRLLQRYTAGTRYRLMTTQDSEQALTLVEKFSPQIIVLDVMMPEVDGWEVLGRLRQHPLTRQIPIVVCTVLSQEELALSLGASDFLRKPVTRRAFLAALDDQIELMGPESR